MRLRLIGFFLVLASMVSGFARAAAGPQYYLALGDSLALGFQLGPGGDVPTNQGYVDHLYALARLKIPNLQLLKLGCFGETTTSMIDGGSCHGLTSQLDLAADFLRSHRGQVALVTLDVGANNVDGCVTLDPLGTDDTCFVAGANTAAADLRYIILPRLQAAAGRQVPIIGMNYYDPFLAGWQLDHTFAQGTLAATLGFNTLLGIAYQSAGVPVADVASAFHITNFNPVPVVDLPLNVFLELSWTWISAPPPLGPDVHPNAAGYAVIAGAFLKALVAP
jgi:lysophospholipase L1-like esterase